MALVRYISIALKIRMNLILFLSWQIGPFWAVMKKFYFCNSQLLLKAIFPCFHGQKLKKFKVLFIFSGPGTIFFCYMSQLQFEKEEARLPLFFLNNKIKQLLTQPNFFNT